METGRENRLIMIFVILAFIVLFVIAFVLLGFHYYDDFLKLTHNIAFKLIGGGGALL